MVSLVVLPVGAGSPWVHVLSCTPHERSCTHSSSDHRLPLNAAWAERWRPCAATCGLCNTHHLSGMHVCPAQRCPHCQPHGLSSPRTEGAIRALCGASRIRCDKPENSSPNHTASNSAHRIGIARCFSASFPLTPGSTRLGL